MYNIFLTLCITNYSCLSKIYVDNDFQSPAYGKQYNDLQKLAFDDGRLKITGCPDKV